MKKEQKLAVFKKRFVWIFCMTLCLVFAGCKDGSDDQADPAKAEESSENQVAAEETTTGGILTETETIDDVTLDGMSMDILKGMSTEEKVGQMLFVGLDSIRTDGKTGTLTSLKKETEKSVTTLSPGGIILYSKNMKTQEQTKEMIGTLQEWSRIPLFIGSEEEGGKTSRIASVKGMKIKAGPEAKELGEAGDSQKVQEEGSRIGAYMKDLGFNLNFAPVADVAAEEEQKILDGRSYGTDSKQVSDMVEETVKGIQSQNVSAVLKYFPGQGSLKEDTHKGSVDVAKTIKELRETEFVPFQAGIEAGADFVMVGHASYSLVTGNQTPASLSSLILSEILRNELRFQSVIITDSMNMKAITEVYSSSDAAVKAIEAGADMILCPDNGKEIYEGILQAVKEGKIEEDRINESVLRILKVKIKREIIPRDTDLIEQSK